MSGELLLKGKHCFPRLSSGLWGLDVTDLCSQPGWEVVNPSLAFVWRSSEPPAQQFLPSLEKLPGSHLESQSSY